MEQIGEGTRRHHPERQEDLRVGAHLVLSALDGRFSDAHTGYSVVTWASEEAQQARRSRGMDWFPDGVDLGCLHEPFREDEARSKEGSS